LLGVHGNKPVVAIPVRANVSGDDMSESVETIGDKGPITAIRPEKVLQELIVMCCP
jgi:hypothetical protein